MPSHPHWAICACERRRLKRAPMARCRGRRRGARDWSDWVGPLPTPRLIRLGYMIRRKGATTCLLAGEPFTMKVRAIRQTIHGDRTAVIPTRKLPSGLVFARLPIRGPRIEFNHVSVDVCLSGNRDVHPTRANDIKMISECFADACGRQEVTPRPTVLPHKGSPGSSTACPGRNTTDAWNSVVAACAGSNVPPPEPQRPTLFPGVHGVIVVTLQHELNVGASQHLAEDGAYGPLNDERSDRVPSIPQTRCRRHLWTEDVGDGGSPLRREWWSITIVATSSNPKHVTGGNEAAAISAGCTAETYKPAQQKEYTERNGEDVPAAQTISDCVKGVGHDDEQPDEHERDSSRARHPTMVREKAFLTPFLPDIGDAWLGIGYAGAPLGAPGWRRGSGVVAPS